MTDDRMYLDFALYAENTLLYQGALLATTELNTSCFGGYKHFSIASIEHGSQPLQVPIFDGLVIEHQFQEGACFLVLRFFEAYETDSSLIPFKQRLRLDSTIRVPRQHIMEWDNIPLGNDHVLAFKCSLLP